METHLQIYVRMGATGAKKQFFIPSVRDPRSLHLVGYMTNGGTPGLPLIIKVGEVNGTATSIVAGTSEALAQSGTTCIAVSEPDKGKWQNVNSHSVGSFSANKTLHAMTVEVIDSSTQAAAAYTVPAPAVDIVVLKFELRTAHSYEAAAREASVVKAHRTFVPPGEFSVFA